MKYTGLKNHFILKPVAFQATGADGDKTDIFIN